ncbi:hypothetical protein [Thermoactinomyces sp. CICC 10522]|uniref:hypothetical protein n=1 Tax=Thermoactinomyces sp. CICC 10522 TaxID=2767427 RepID=UPI0018DB2AB4|nr:hypothetical protein [Thermoactinomyces sp. CICC 10522]MBH8603664.1 hypothetical protein [Thermoactinomyces sp. CICC 10522]
MKFTVINKIEKLGAGVLFVKSDIFDDAGVFVSTVDNKVVSDNEKAAVLAHLDAVKTALVTATATECHFATNSGIVFNKLQAVYSQLSTKDADYAAKWDEFEAAGVPITGLSKVSAY